MKKTLARIGLITLLAALLAGAFILPALAQGSAKQVGLVVRFSDGTEHSQIVSVPAAATAMDALLASSLDVTWVDLGWGVSICGINTDGCPAGDCFCDPNHFWAFWTLNAGGADWDASPVGASAVTPADKDVIGFSWSGFDENYAPTVKPTPHTFAELEQLLEAPAPQEVPEPATILLLGGGLASLAGYVGLRRRAK